MVRRLVIVSRDYPDVYEVLRENFGDRKDVDVILDRIEDLARFFRIAIGEQLHRTLQVGEEDGTLLALALECAVRRLGSFDSTQALSSTSMHGSAMTYGIATSCSFPLQRSSACGCRGKILEQLLR